MDIIVQKYGGSSVSTKAKLKRICERIIKTKEIGNEMLIVVSAQGKTTDKLLKKSKIYSTSPNLKCLDVLLSTGEMETTSLIGMILEEKGYKVKLMTGGMTGIITDSNYGDAKIIDINFQNILNYLKEGYIVITSGFQGMDRYGNITTLGRGGSDLTAIAIASALKAKKCEFYKDVDGILSANPKIIKNPKLIKNISYNEMLEASSSGSKILQNRSVNFAKKNNIELYVNNSASGKNGTIVTSTLNENSEIKIISKKDGLTKISIISDMISENRELFKNVFDIAFKMNIKIEMISYSEISLNIIVNENDANNLINMLHKVLIEKNQENS